MQTYSKEREKSALVKHYHQEQLKRLQKKLGEIRHRKKAFLPLENKQNSLPILPPRYILPITRQLQISDQNTRLGSRIAQMKTKQSQYFRKILKQKQRVKNIQYNQKNRKQSKKVKLIYSGSVSGLFANYANVTMRDDMLLEGNRSGGMRAVTQRHKKI